MKIAINCSYYGSKGGGIKEYIYNLVSNLNKVLKKPDTIICYIPKDQLQFWIDTMPANIRYKCTPFTIKQPIRRSLFQQRFWSHEEKKEQFDIFHSPFFYAPKLKNALTILTVHDLRFMKYPESYTFLRVKYLRYKVPKALKAADSVITISEFTKNEAVKYFSVDTNKFKVIHEAVNLENFSSENEMYTDNLKQKCIKKDNYILAVGHIEPRKNYNRLIKAFDKLVHEKNINYKLVIVGKENYKTESTLKLIEESPNTIYLGWVQFKELLWLYSNCIFHVFPSYYEGFGFPTLEAAAFGKVTIAANASSIPEIGNDGAIYFNPFSIEDIYEKLAEAIYNPNLILEKSHNAIKNLDNFSWLKNAQETYDVYMKTFGRLL